MMKGRKARQDARCGLRQLRAARSPEFAVPIDRRWRRRPGEVSQSGEVYIAKGWASLQRREAAFGLRQLRRRSDDLRRRRRGTTCEEERDTQAPDRSGQLHDAKPF